MVKFDNYEIRLLEIHDVEDYFNLVNKNRKRLEDFFVGTTSKTKTYEETKDFVSWMTKRIDEKSYFPFIVVDTTNMTLVGFIDLKNIDWSIPKSELGFFIDKDYAGKGITTKSVKKLCEFCFDKYNFEKIFLRTHPSNIAAISVAEKCGFELEGTIRKDYKKTSGELVDLNYYGLLKQSF